MKRPVSRRALLAGLAASVAANEAPAVGLLSFVKSQGGGSLAPSITSLPSAVGGVGNWNSFPGASWALNTPFTDTTGAVLRRVTNASSPVTNNGMAFEYATGGPRISRPFGASLDTYHVAVLLGAGQAGGGSQIVFFDVQRGVGYVSGTYKTTPFVNPGGLCCCWSSNPAEPHILIFSDKASPDTIHRYDINAGAYASNTVFNGTNASISAGGNQAGWFQMNWAGTHLGWTTPYASPTSIHSLDLSTGTVTTNSSAGVANINDIRICKGLTKVFTCANNDGTKSYWYVPTNVLSSAFTSASHQGHSDMGETYYYCWNADDANYPLLRETLGAAPASNGSAPTITETTLYNSGAGSQAMSQDSHPNMCWDQTGAGTSEWYLSETDPGSSNLNTATANGWTVDSGSVYKTAVSFGGYSATSRGVNGVYVLDGSGTYIGNLTSVGSRGAVVAGTFFWDSAGTTLYAQMPASGTPTGFTRLVANAKITEAIGFAKADGTDIRKACYTYRNEKTYNYETTPFCNQSPDGKILMFCSNFGVDAGRVDIVMAELPLA